MTIRTFGDCTDEELRAMVAEGQERDNRGLVATATAVLESRTGPRAVPTRYAVVSARTSREVAAYLPDNYKLLHTVDEPGGVKCVIGGKDAAGWTLDGYVTPRLASGLLFAREHRSYEDAVESAAAAMA